MITAFASATDDTPALLQHPCDDLPVKQLSCLNNALPAAGKDGTILILTSDSLQRHPIMAP